MGSPEYPAVLNRASPFSSLLKADCHRLPDPSMQFSFVNTAARLRNRYGRFMAYRFGRRSYTMQNKEPFISFSFDDFPVSAVTVGGAILKQHGFAGTYYASLGLMGQDSPTGLIFSSRDLEKLLDDGHELGCHTFAHCHAWETEPRVFEESILENRRALEKVVPGASFKTMSYPIACPRPETKRRMGKYFACCRGGGQTLNAGSTDLNYLSAFFLEQSRHDPGAVKRMIERNCRAYGWLIFATHDVCDAPSPFGCTPDFFEIIVRCAASCGARVLPVGAAWEAISGSAD